MSDFEKREKGFEAKFKLDEELRFKATARRNRLLGLWAAELMGLGADEADAYAKEVIKADFEKPGDDDVLQKVLGDLQGKNIETSDRLVRKQMDELMDVAVQQIQADS